MKTIKNTLSKDRFFRCTGGGKTVYIQAKYDDRAIQCAVEVIWNIKMPKTVIWETPEQQRYYDSISITELITYLAYQPDC